MEEKVYNAYDVLLGIFNRFPSEFGGYRSTYWEINEFFFDNRDKYSVLNDLAFDGDGVNPESKELWEAYETLNISGLVYYLEASPFIDILNKPAIEIAFEKFSKRKFDNKELGELEKLSEEFRKTFC